MLNWLRRDDKYWVTNISKKSAHEWEMSASNALGGHMTWIYDGRNWRWDTTGHLVDCKLNRQLTKVFIRDVTKFIKED